MAKSIRVLLLLLIICVVSYGCKKTSHKKIQFNKENGLYFNSSNQNLNLPDSKKDVLKKSSGIIIYKDNSTNGQNNFKLPKFEPKDLEFDIKVK